jgi:deoxyribodipyrimidine photo-lyase
MNKIPKNKEKALVWFRRDLRLEDHAALEKALVHHEKVFLLFVFDEHILSKLSDSNDQRLGFLVDSLTDLEEQLRPYKASILFGHGKPETLIPQLARDLGISSVYTHRDFEPYAKKRDKQVREALQEIQVDFDTSLDHVILDPDLIRTQQGKVYTVFTPFKKRWLEIFQDSPVKVKKISPALFKKVVSAEMAMKVGKESATLFTSAKQIYQHANFTYRQPFLAGGEKAAQALLKKFSKGIKNYDKSRDLLGEAGTSQLSVYLRHGCLSARQAHDFCRQKEFADSQGAKIWQSELIWREFYQYLLNYYPSFGDTSFIPKYQKAKWPGKEKDFDQWALGETGFPIIDAAMRCLNLTGTMPNRARMIVASFLSKLLLVEWQKGERHFARLLLDFDLAANAGGWQWCASTGADPVPYFRIFNPYLQSKKFDGSGKFIRQFVPELSKLESKYLHRPDQAPKEVLMRAGINLGKDYPLPMIDYENARVKALAWFKSVQ